MQNWKRNLTIMWIAQFFAMVGMSAITPFLPLFIRELGVSNTDAAARWSGFVFAGPFLLSFFLSPVWGNLGDQYGRKIMTLRAIFGLAIAQLLTGFAQDPTQLLLARLFQGALSGFLPAAMALIAANTPENKTGYALGVLQSSTAAGNVLGPFIGGVLADLIGYRSVFYLVSLLLFLIGIFIMLFIKENLKPESNIKKASWLDNWSIILGSSYLRTIAILISLTSLGLAFIRPIFVFYIESFPLNQEYLATITGSIYGIVGVFTVFSAAWWGKQSEKRGFRKNLIYAASITGIMYALHFFVYNFVWLIPIRALLGFGFGALSPLLFTLISNEASQERKGGLLGVATSFQILGNMMGPIFSGMIAGLLGFRFPFFITGGVFLSIAFITFLRIRK